VDVTHLKNLAFTVGGFYAGVAGAMYAHLYGFLHPSSFSTIKGFDPLIIIVFGGLGSMTGTVLASVMFALVIEGLRVLLPQGFEDWRFVIYPVILLLIMLLRSQGLMGTSEWGWLRQPLPPERDIPAPSHSGHGHTVSVPGEEA
jgi:branched-chain amino acid transport system permease protein